MNEKLLNYYSNDDFPAGVWEGKYAQEGETTPDDMHMRMAKQFARIEAKYTETERKLEVPLLQQRVSKYGLIRKELDAHKIYNLFKDFKYIIPQGSIMSQLGSKSIGSLSNCFVIGQPEDSYGGIFKKDEEQAQLMKRRGGVGQDLSSLRPKGTSTSNAAKSSTGPISFAHRFSNTTREVAQDGRRGALMLSIDIKHPDSLEFIKSKRNSTDITGANISVKIGHDFMKAVVNDEDFILRWPCNFTIPEGMSFNIDYDTLTELPNSNSIKFEEEGIVWEGKNVLIKKIKAKELWNEIIESAHGFAEPGIIFEDNHHDYSPDSVYSQFKGITTNPCGEIFMQAYDACRLIAVNFFSFVVNPFTKDAYFDHQKFYEVNYEAMRLSDDLIDLEMEHISRIIRKIDADPESFEVKRTERELWEKVYKTAKASRRTGLGITALGDCLAALGLKYDSALGILEIDKIMHTKMQSELACTIDMSITRGSFKGWDKTKEFDLIASNELVGNNPFYSSIYENYPEEALRMFDYGRRNVSWSTIAPTGSLSIIAKAIKYANLSSGMEPVFMPYYMRRKKVNPNDTNTRVDFIDDSGDTWQEYPIVMGAFKDWLEQHGNYKDQEYNNWNEVQMKDAFESSPWFGSTANDIDWIKRVEIQAVLQKYITHSISSTVNLPNDVSKKEVGDIYIEAWKQGLKGITVYRDGSRSGVLVLNDSKNKSFACKDAIKRPKELKSETYKFKSKENNYTAIIGLLEGKPYEVFLDKSSNVYSPEGRVVKEARGKYIFKNGVEPIDILTFMTDEEEAITRLVSSNLRHGTDIKFVVEQLQKTGGDMFSFTKGLARVLKKFIPNGAKSTMTCNDCSSTNVIFQEGCLTCRDCGSSKCG